MRRIRALRLLAGPWGTLRVGQTGDVPDHVADLLVQSGAAEAIETATATRPASARTATAPKRGRPRKPKAK